MNVNPFSYLIEKLKGKVDKSGDTMTGKLTIEQNTDTPLSVKRTNMASAVYMEFSNHNGVIGYLGVSSNKKPIFHDTTDKQIALASDIANMPITLNKQIATNESVSFEIPNNGLATIVVGHPYTGTWGEYAVIGGYTTGSNAITTFHASTAVSSIVKTSNNIVKLTCNSGIFVYCTGVGVSLA